MDNEYGIREDALEMVINAVQGFENYYNGSYGEEEPPTTLECAIEHCWREYNECVKSYLPQVSGRATRFSGNAKILNAIKSEILKSKYIKFK